MWRQFVSVKSKMTDDNDGSFRGMWCRDSGQTGFAVKYLRYRFYMSQGHLMYPKRNKSNSLFKLNIKIVGNIHS